MITRRTSARLVLLGLLPLLSSCGRSWGHVSGTVRYQGKPLPNGTITFYDEANQAVSAHIEADGKYTVSDKVAAGKVKITVTAPMPVFLPGDQTARKQFVNMPNLPTRYADAEKSGLDRDVKSGSQTIDFDLN
jgi:hypothetical protein